MLDPVCYTSTDLVVEGGVGDGKIGLDDPPASCNAPIGRPPTSVKAVPVDGLTSMALAPTPVSMLHYWWELHLGRLKDQSRS